MLNAMRKQASSLGVRILLGVLIISFAVWGVGDLFLGGGNQAVVAEVGELEVGLGDVNRTFEQSYQQLNQSLGGAVDRQAAIAFGLLDQAVQSRIAERLVDMHATDLGLGVADSEVRQVIQNEPAFRGVGGFDRQTMDFFLRSQGLTEVEFIDDIRNEIRRRAILTALTETVPVSTTLANLLNAHRNQQRQATALIVTSAEMNVDDPDDATLQTYLEDNQSQFEAPEYRSGVVIMLEPADLVAEIAVDDEVLREIYQSRLMEFTTQEVRELGQLLAPDQETADAVMEALAEGSDFAAVADQFSDQGVSYSAIGPVNQFDLPEQLSEAAFALDMEAVSDPVASDFGFHIFKPIDIEPGSQEPFEDVRDSLAEDYALREATDQLPDLAASLDDEVAAGETLEAAAETLQLQLNTIAAISAAGSLRDGGLERPSPDVLAAFFQGELGEASLLEETDNGGYFIYRVDAIEEARPQELAEAREEVLAAWRNDALDQAAKAEAERILGQAGEGRALAAIAEEAGERIELVETQPLFRSDTGSADGLSRQAVTAMFEIEEGDFAPEVVQVRYGYAVVRLDAIIDAPEGSDISMLEQEIQQSRRVEVLGEYETHLRQLYPISINDASLQYFYQQDG